MKAPEEWKEAALSDEALEEVTGGTVLPEDVQLNRGERGSTLGEETNPSQSESDPWSRLPENDPWQPDIDPLHSQEPGVYRCYGIAWPDPETGD